jgi:hypothetical protein
MNIVLGSLVDEPYIAMVARAAPVVVGARFPTVKDRLVLTLIVGRAQREGALRLVDHEGRPVAAGSSERFLQRVELRRRHADVHGAVGDGEDAAAEFPAHAKNYTAGPVKIVLPYPPGEPLP